MIVDAHQHFWQLERGDYDWLQPHQAELYRDCLPGDLQPLLEASGVGATVLVQAAASEAETRYLFELARSHAFVAGVVGWTDFEDPDVSRHIDHLVVESLGCLKGLRPMVQGLPSPHWLLQPTLDVAFEAMVEHGLVFDALVKPLHLPPLRSRLAQHPGLRVVIDHAGKPDISSGRFGHWADDIAAIASETGAFCKLSGLLTEAGTHASVDGLEPCVSHLFECFGPDRLLWGSDWPIVNLCSSYAQWLEMARELVRRHAGNASHKIFATNAIGLYSLNSLGGHAEGLEAASA